MPCFALRLRSLAVWTQRLVSTACFDAQVHYGVDLGTKSPNLSSDWVGQNHCRIDTVGWLGSRVVSVLDSGAEGLGFKSQSRRCRELLTPIVPLFTKHQNL